VVLTLGPTIPSLAEKVAIALSKVGDKFSINQRKSIFASLRFEALRLIYQLVTKVDPVQRCECIEKIIELSSPIDFSLEIAQWLLTSSEDSKEKQILHDIEINKLRQHISSKLTTYFSQHKISDYKGSLKQLFVTWSILGDKGVTSQCIQIQLRDTPELVIPLINQFYQELWIEYIGNVISVDATTKTYDILTSIVSDNVIFRATQKLVKSQKFQPALIADAGYSQKISPEQVTQHNVALFIEEFNRWHQPKTSLDTLN
jgi:hypothetical protein